MDENKTAATEQETTDAAAGIASAEPAGTADADAGTTGAEAQQTAAPDAEAKADAAKAETAAQADKADVKPVAEEGKKEPAKDAAKAADEKAKADAAQVEVLTAKVGKVETQLRKAMARAAALMAGVRPDRVDKAVLLADMKDLDPMTNDADEKFKAALQAVVNDMPELAAPPAGTGSPGAFQRKTEPTKDVPFLQGLRSTK